MLYRNIILLATFLGILGAQDHGWSFEPNGSFAYVVFQSVPEIDGVPAIENDVVAAFYNEQCIGYVNIDLDTETTLYVYMQEDDYPSYIPEGGQPSFKIYDSDRDVVLDLDVGEDMFPNGIQLFNGTFIEQSNATCPLPGPISPTVTIADNNIDISWDVPYIDANGNDIYDDGDTIDGYQPLSFFINGSLVSETDSYEELSYSFSDLEWCESYPVTFLASNNCGENTVIDEIYDIYPGQPGIINVIESDGGEGFADISWDHEIFSDIYNIYMDIPSDGVVETNEIDAWILDGAEWTTGTISVQDTVFSSYERELVLSTELTNIAIDNLDASTDYTFYINGQSCNNEISPEDVAVNVQTDEISSPLNISASPDGGRILLGWDDVTYASEGAEYDIFLSSINYTEDYNGEDIGFSDELYYIKSVSSTSTHIPYLEDAEYCFRLRSKTSLGNSELSDEVCAINEGTSLGLSSVDWGIQVKAEFFDINNNMTTYDEFNLLGVHENATDDVDNFYDAEEPSASPTGGVSLYFKIGNEDYTQDVRAPEDLSSSTKTWDMFFQAYSDLGLLSLTFYYINNDGFFDNPDRNIPYLYYNDEFTRVEDGMKISIDGLISQIIDPPLKMIIGNAVPNPPINVSAEAGYREIEVSWSPSDSQNINFPASEYYVFRNCGICDSGEDPVAIVSETSYIDRGLDFDTEYSYSIKGKNIAGVGLSSTQSDSGAGCDNSGLGCATTLENRTPIANAGHDLVVYFESEKISNINIPFSSNKDLGLWTTGNFNLSFDPDNYYLLDSQTTSYDEPLDELVFDWGNGSQESTISLSYDGSFYSDGDILGYELTIDDQNFSESVSSDSIYIELKKLPVPAKLDDSQIQFVPRLSTIELEWSESSYTGESYIDKNGDGVWSDSEILFDCGLDNICPGSPGYIMPDEDGTENNGDWDFEDLNLNFKYDGPIVDGHAENWVESDGNGVYDSDTEFIFNNILIEEDCIYNWNDGICFKDIGNGIFDDDEPFVDESNNSGYYNGIYDSGSRPRPPFFGFENLNSYSDEIALSYDVYSINSSETLATIYRYNCIGENGEVVDNSIGECSSENLGEGCGPGLFGLCEEITGNEQFRLDINDYYDSALEYDVDYCFYIDAVNESGRSRSNEVCAQLAQPPKADIVYPFSSKVFEAGDGFDMLIDIENGPFVSVLEVFEVGGPGSFNGGTTEEILIQSLDFSNDPLESGIFSCPVGAGLQTRYNEQVSDDINIKIVLTDIAGNAHEIFSGYSCVNTFGDVIPGSSGECHPGNVGGECSSFIDDGNGNIEIDYGACTNIGTYSVSNDNLMASLGEGWSMFGTPLSVSDNESQLLEDNVSLNQGFMLAFDQDQNQNNIELQSGAGYYLYLIGTGGQGEINISGDVLSSYSIPLELGWNLIANPLPTTIDRTDLEIDNGIEIMPWSEAVRENIISSSLIGFDNNNVSHVDSKKMEPFNGYWVHVAESGVNLNVSLPSPNESDSLSIYESLDTQFELNLSSRQSGNPGPDSMGDQIVLGLSASGSDGYSYGEDQIHLPISSSLTPSFTAMFIDRQDWVDEGLIDERQFFKDTRSTADTLYTWNIKGVVNGVWGDITLSWDKSTIDNLSDNVHLSLITSDAVYSLSENGTESGMHSSIYLSSDSETYNIDISTNEYSDFIIEYNDTDNIPGCTKPDACNYDPSATLDVGCDYSECWGCSDPNAVNYDIDSQFYQRVDGEKFWRSCDDVPEINGDIFVESCCMTTGYGMIFDRDEARYEVFIEQELQNELPIILRNPENIDVSAISLSFIFDDEVFDFPSDIGGFRLSQMLDGSSSDAIFQYEMNIVDDRVNIEIYSTNFAVSDSIIDLGVLLPIMDDGIDFTDIDTESVIAIDNDIIAINGSTVLDGLNLFTENGSFILKEGLFDFAGQIHFPSTDNSFAVDSVQVTIEGIPKYSNFLNGESKLVYGDMTLSDGTFEVNDIVKGDYSLIFHKSTDFNDDAVKSSDAALVARKAVGISPLFTNGGFYQWTKNSWHNPAGNATLNLGADPNYPGYLVDIVQSFDCTHIAKYAVGLISNINNDQDDSGEQGKNWIFGVNHNSDSRTFNPMTEPSNSEGTEPSLGYEEYVLNADLRYRNADYNINFNFDHEDNLMDNRYVGVRIGDSTMSWADVNNNSEVPRGSDTNNRIALDIEELEVITLPLYIKDSYCGTGIDIDIRYDGLGFSMLDLTLSEHIQNSFTIFENRTNDRFRLAAYNTQNVCNLEGQIGTVTFQVVNNGIDQDQFTSLSSILIDEQRVYAGFVINDNYGTLYQDLMLNDNSLPESYNLYQNYPNPFNPITNIRFALPENEYISISIFDINGRIIDTISENQFYQAGYHSVVWNASSFPSGIYFLKFSSQNYNASSKLILVK